MIPSTIVLQLGGQRAPKQLGIGRNPLGHGHVDVPPPGTPGTARRTPAASRRAQIPRENDSVRIARLLGRAKQRDDRMAVQRIVRLAATPAVDVPDNRIARLDDAVRFDLLYPIGRGRQVGENSHPVHAGLSPRTDRPEHRSGPAVAGQLHRDDHGPAPRLHAARPSISTSHRRGKNRRSHPISPRTQARRSVARTEQTIQCHRSLHGPAIRVPPLSHSQPLTQTHR